jgi:hypothetical protein
MDLERWRRARRALSAAVLLLAVALVMSRTGTEAATEASSQGTAAGFVLSVALVGGLMALLVVWRKEHASAEAEFHARELQTLAMLKMQAALAKQKSQPDEGADSPTGPGPSSVE